MTDGTHEPSSPTQGHHLATISHVGRFWEVYHEFEDDPRRLETYRALLAFLPGDPADGPRRRRSVADRNAVDKPELGGLANHIVRIRVIKFAPPGRTRGCEPPRDERIAHHVAARRIALDPCGIVGLHHDMRRSEADMQPKRVSFGSKAFQPRKPKFKPCMI